MSSSSINLFIIFLLSLLLNFELVEREAFPMFSRNKREKSLENALLNGRKLATSHELTKPIKFLNMHHLFVPSGLHASFIFKPINYILKSLHNRINFSFFIGILLIIFAQFYEYNSLERIGIFKSINSLLNSNKISFHAAFLVSMILLSNYAKSPLSFLYSFLFWGVIIFSSNFYSKIFNLYLALNLLCWVNYSDLSIFSCLFNFLLSSLYALLYPILMFNHYFSAFEFQNDFNCLFFKYYENLIMHSYLFIKSLPIFKPSYILMTLSPILSIIRWKYQLIFLLLLPLDITIDHDSQKKPNLNPIPQVIKSSKENSACIHFIYYEKWVSKCKKKRKHKLPQS